MRAAYTSPVVVAAFWAILAAVPIMGHAEMVDPPSFASRANPNPLPNEDTYENKAPVGYGSAGFPCRGYHKHFESATPVATYEAGKDYQVTLDVATSMGGGSCQLSLSHDGGNSWEVIKSIIGDCPAPTGESEQKIQFTMPADVQNGKALFAWSNILTQGNQEFYMDCAAIDITGGSDSSSDSTRPELFVANVGREGCTTQQGFILEYPNPGDDVERRSNNTAPPECGSLPQGGVPVPTGVDSSTKVNPTEAVEPKVDPVQCKSWSKRKA